ncbi:S24 family peptidase [Campylobacter lari]|nr:S24 family peptidase [Campylobacter lari]MCV3501438.1 S24 family peptidase [Campylobacter lari]
MFYKLNKEYLTEVLKEKKISRSKLAQMLTDNGYEISLDGIAYWYRSENNQPENYENVIKIAQVLNVPIEKLAPINDNIKTNIIPLLKKDNQIEFKYYPDVSASAGYGVLAQDINYTSICVDGSFLKEILDIPIKKSYDIIKINGDSMEPLLTHGDFVVIDRSKNTLGTISSADIVIFRQGEDLYCKKIKKEAFCDFIYLVSENKDYKEVKISDFAQCEIIGVVVSKMTVETFKNFIEVVR